MLLSPSKVICCEEAALIGRRLSNLDVTPGSVFYRNGVGGLVETARVLSIAKDGYGIPHVRFEVNFRYPSSSCTHDSRVLALSSFASQYPDRI